MEFQSQSGSSALYISDFQKIGEELRSQYVLSYTPTNPVLDGTYRKVRVEMTDKKFKARTRQGYFAVKND
jgi:hypothetical protein